MNRANLIFWASFKSFLLTIVLLDNPVWATAGSSDSWNPAASEKLVKLPAHYLKKRLDYDFSESGLGKALTVSKSRVVKKGQTLNDLRQAMDQADGALKLELRHQFLAEKREYIQLTGKKNRLYRKKLNTDLKVYKKLLDKLSDKGAISSASRKQLIVSQKQAQKRFQSSLNRVDMKVFQSAVVPESAYSVKYAENQATIEKLVAGIQNHRMNASASDGDTVLTKSEYIRKMVTDTQAELAILNQEQTIMGYMAKIVALDAAALSDELIDAEIIDSDIAPKPSLASAVDFFISN